MKPRFGSPLFWALSAIYLLGCAGAAPQAGHPESAGEVAVVDLGNTSSQAKTSAPQTALEVAPANTAAAPSESEEDPDANSKEASASKEAAEPKDEKQFGMLGLLNAGALTPIDMNGAMQGSGFGGVGGLGLSGSGGSGGSGTGVGSIGTLGRGSGGLGSRLGAAGGSKPPSIRAETPTAVGKLDPEIIRRVVRASFNRFRYCYEKSLVNNPKLEGKVIVQFVIGTDGAVKSANDAQSPISDKNTVQCVVSAFKTLSFPKPENGIVVVTYPLVFKPGENTSAPASASAQPPAPSPGASAPAATTAPKASPPPSSP